MSSGVVLVEVKRTFVPADVERLLGGLTRRLRDSSGGWPILLVSEFLGPRTRRLLIEEDINYLDLTGNLRLVMKNPPMFIETTGLDRRPSQSRGKRVTGLSGVIAGKVIRFLVEVEPPYGVLDIEGATGISRGYVSRILDRLTDEALLKRAPRGPVESVDWPALLRARGESVDLFAANTMRAFLAPNGAKASFDAIAESTISDRVVVTGSFAAVRIAPIAAPALLVLYIVPDEVRGSFDAVAQELRLLPADESPNVVLLRPNSPQPIEDLRLDGGLKMVNFPQLVVDCLGGSGRMPSEGEAVLEWMMANEAKWRFSSLAAYLAKHPRQN